MTAATRAKGSSPSKPRPAPAGTGKAGRAFWREVVGTYSLSPGELPLLALAARQADDTAALEALLASDGLSVAGSMGQMRLNAVVTELRQSRLALVRMLDALALPVEQGGASLTPAQRRARQAADARWDGHRTIQERRARLTAGG